MTSDANGAPLSNGFFLISIEGSVGYQIYDYELLNADETAPCYPQGVLACGYGTSVNQTGFLMFNLQPGVNTIQVDLSTSTLAGVTGDFSRTAAIDLRLPSGVTYTSDSGVFLSTAVPVDTAPPPITTPVPEPSTYLLMLAGLWAVIATFRGRGTS